MMNGTASQEKALKSSHSSGDLSSAGEVKEKL